MLPFVPLSFALEAADPRQADVERVRTRFAPDAFAGVEAPTFDSAGSVMLASAVQYEHEPVVMYHEDQYAGAAVGDRIGLSLGFSLAITDWLAVGASFPTALDTNSSATAYSHTGFSGGDLAAILRVRAYERHGFRLAFQTELYTPTGALDSFMGEGLVRPAAGIVADYRKDRWGVGAQVTAMYRPDSDTSAHWERGSELTAGGLVRYALVAERVSLAAAASLGLGVASPSQAANQGAECFLGFILQPSRVLSVSPAMGIGIAPGVGVPSWRATVNIGIRPRKRATAQSTIEVDESQLPLDRALITSPNPEARPLTTVEITSREAEEPARVEGTEIRIRDPIQFEFATDRLLPSSKPTLAAVAQLMVSDGRIAHVVVQGHASEEGSFEYNYDLSSRRARTVWEILIQSGVHPNRLSYQGMGEVEPTNAVAAEQALAQNRRVIFRIVHFYAPGDAAPPLSSLIALPWSGETAPAINPPPPAAPAPPLDPFEDDE